jgi:uncharacterized membrane protein
MRVRRDERGQTLPLVVLLVAFVIVVAMALARLAINTSDRVRAQAAADAAALAGAIGGRDAARAIADANNAVLVSFAQEGDIVTVEVARGGRHAGARAEAVVEPTGS